MDELENGAMVAAPLYREVRRRLLDNLATGAWAPGDALPAEGALARQFNVSIGTLRKAVDELVADGMLVRQQGRGTFVARHNRDRLLFYFFHVVAEDGHKEYPRVTLLGFERTRADADTALHLGMREGERVLRIRNVLELSGRPVILDDIRVPAARFPGLTERKFRTRTSTIYNLYQDSFGISVVRTAERLRAGVADATAARLLGVPRGQPLLRIRRVAYSYHDDPVELRYSLVDTAHHEYYSELRRG
jgi:GntR family transcriptional regulator